MVQLSPVEVKAARIGGWQFIAALVTFVAGVVTIIATSDSRYAEAEQAAADRLDVSVADLPAVELARLNAEYGEFGGGLIVMTVLLNLGMILFALAVGTTLWAAVGEGVKHRLLSGAAGTLALAAPLGWIVYLTLNAAVASGGMPPGDMLDLYDRFAMPAMAVSGAGGALALICLVVLLRGRGLVRRTGLVVLALAALTALGAAVVGVPPVVPCLLGTVLGVVLVRTRSAAEAPAEVPVPAVR